MQELPIPVFLDGRGAVLENFGTGDLIHGLAQPDTRPMAEARRLYEQISQKLAKAIADNKYELGQRLPSERELAQSFGVSRPTKQKTNNTQKQNGLVEVRLSSGVY